MSELGYHLFDADNHYYEGRDAFTRYIEPAYRHMAVQARPDEHGKDRIWIGERRFNFLDDTDFNFDTAMRPGSLREFLRTLTKEIPADSGVVEQIRPEAIHRDARVAFMDAHGIEACILFPTLGVCLEPLLKHDLGALYANYRAFNRWLDEEWGLARDGRIYTPPMISLRDVDAAVKELEWVLERGARIIAMIPGPVGGQAPGHPMFDAFWSRANEAGVTVAFHVGESGYNELFSVHWGEQPHPSSHSQSAFQWTNFYGDRPIMDTISSLIYHNFFGRHPNVKAYSVENGSLWVPYLMKAMDKMKGMGRNGPWPGGRPPGLPSEILKRHVFVNPYHEEDHVALVRLIGASQVVFGSDYPHPEGLEDPAGFPAQLAGKLSPDELRMVLRDNGRRLVRGN
jgi:predicted TIM-barrel fold metal-dependent hydrolase